MKPADFDAVGRFVASRDEPVAFIACETRDSPMFERGIYRTITERFGPEIGQRLRLCVPPYDHGSLQDLVAPIARCKTVISSRYHGILTAAWAGCCLLYTSQSEFTAPA